MCSGQNVDPRAHKVCSQDFLIGLAHVASQYFHDLLKIRATAAWMVLVVHVVD